MLENLAIYKEKIESLKGKIKKALYYPAAVILIGLVISAILMIFVVPQFEEIFKSFGAKLPAMTQAVIAMSRFTQKYWWVIGLVLGGAAWGFIYANKNFPQFSHTVDRTMLKFPVIGGILRKAAVARFCRTLAITFAAGLPLLDALKIVAGATGNALYHDASFKIREAVAEGQQLQFAMKNTQLFPPMVIQMVAIGEESGTLEKTLAKVAGIYEEEIDNTVDSLSSLLEPLIMVILGVLVGGMVIAMYLPIFQLGNVVS